MSLRDAEQIRPSGHADDLRARQIEDLIVDHLQRRLNGENVTDAGVILRYPELMPELAERLREVAELQTLQETKPQGTTDHASSLDPRLLHIRCPHCRQSTHVPSDADLDRITCHSCDGQFSLISETSETREAPSYKKIAQFELVERLGLGSFGTVWKARDTALDRTVAVKIPRRGQLEPRQIEKFLREARAASQLNHKNIARLYFVGREDDTVYIVSELVRGVPLADWLTAGQPTFRQAAELCAKICDALHHAHMSGVVHRDLKPQNIVLDRDNEPHLMDFGLAKRERGEVTVTLDGHVLGTPAYMSPEQARGDAHHADRRSDIYSLGVILFELLTGELPFRGNARMLIHQVLNDEPPSPRRLNSSVPRDLETICLKCLAKEPSRRFKTAQDVGSELRRYLAGEPIRSRRITLLERGWNWCRRNRLVSALAATLFISLVSGTLISSWQAVRANRERTIAERHHYQALMNLVQMDSENNEVGRVRASLEEASDYAYRGFEFFYWQRQLHRSQHTFYGHLDRVADVAVSFDGRRMATASNDGTIKIWEIDSGRELVTLHGHTSWVRSVDFFPDGRRLLSSADDLTVRVWDIDTQQELLTLQAHTACRLFSALSRDGQRLVSTSYDGLIKVWNANSGKLLNTKDVGREIWQFALSPDGQRVVWGEENHSVSAGRAWLAALDEDTEPSELNHAGKIWAFEFSSNGKWLATASNDGTAVIWDATTGEKIDTLDIGDTQVTAVAFSPDNASILTGDGGGAVGLWSWDGQSARRIAYLTEHQHFVWGAVFLPDSQRFVTGSSDGTAKLWDITRLDAQTLEHPAHVGARTVTFVQDDRLIVSGADDGLIRIWDEKLAQVIQVIRGHEGSGVNSICAGPSGEWIVAGCDDGVARAWELPTGESRFAAPLMHGAAVTSVCVSPDGRWIATGSDDRTIKIWDSATGSLEKTLAHESGVKSVVFAPNSRHVFANGNPTTICYDILTDDQYDFDWPGPYYPERCLAVSRKQLVIGGRDEWQWPKADVWDWQRHRRLFTLRGHKRSIECGSFSPDGRRIVTAAQDRSLRLWDTSNGAELLTLIGHTDEVRSVAFSSDGLRIASASLDGSVRIWRAATVAEAARWSEQDEAAERFLSRRKSEQLAAAQRLAAQLERDAGAVRQWLMLGPFELHEEHLDDALDTPWLEDEHNLRPREDQRITILGQTRAWRAVRLDHYEFDFSQIFGSGAGRALAYAVCCVDSESAIREVRIRVGNSGIAAMYFNGRQIYRRTVIGVTSVDAKDTIANVSLQPGRNVLICKYVYTRGSWPGSVRFTDHQGNPLSGIQVHTDCH